MICTLNRLFLVSSIEEKMCEHSESICEFFAEKSVLISGGSGFLGKILIEKLIRSCPNINKIYVLMRPKRGKNLSERLNEFTAFPLFDKLRLVNPKFKEKIIPIAGDLSLENLGLSVGDRKILIENVNVIFNVAASVRFDDSLKKAIFTNLRSCRDVIKLATEMNNLAVFEHVSTSYCQIDKNVVEERLYPPFGDWKEAIRIAEMADESVLETLAPKYISPFPNTYTYTKRLAETMVEELCSGKLPTVILRPSIVISTYMDPFQGWLDNLNGPAGLLIGGGKGVVRIVYGNKEVQSDFVVADGVIRSMIAAAWHKAVVDKNKCQISVYNASKCGSYNFKLGQTIEMGKRLRWEVPFEGKLWFPRYKMTKCWYEFYFSMILFNVIPAVFIDTILKIAGYAPILLKIHRKIYIANNSLAHFMSNEWDFVNENYKELEKKLLPVDMEHFRYIFYKNQSPKDIYDYYKRSTDFARYFLLKEPLIISERSIKNTKRMYVLDVFVKCLSVAVLFWLIFIKFNILFKIYTWFITYLSSL